MIANSHFFCAINFAFTDWKLEQAMSELFNNCKPGWAFGFFGIRVGFFGLSKIGF